MMWIAHSRAQQCLQIGEKSRPRHARLHGAAGDEFGFGCDRDEHRLLSQRANQPRRLWPDRTQRVEVVEVNVEDEGGIPEQRLIKCLQNFVEVPQSLGEKPCLKDSVGLGPHPPPAPALVDPATDDLVLKVGGSGRVGGVVGDDKGGADDIRSDRSHYVLIVSKRLHRRLDGSRLLMVE